MASRSVFNREHPPRFVMVCGHKVKVKVVDHLEADNEELLGAYNGDNKTIFLKRSKDWPTNFLHELIHAVLHLSGASEGLSMTTEERLCVALEFGLGPLVLNG